MQYKIEQEWSDLLFSLEEHHAIFHRLWRIGRPKFSSDIDTAAVQFDKTGRFVAFLFNPDFWSSLDAYNKMFVICHECLHLILNHGVRIKDSSFSNVTACNQCLDVVVNQLLVDSFNFDKDKIANCEGYCWIETVFPDQVVPKDESFEYYYNLYEKSYGDGFPSDKICTVDEHGSLEEFDNSLPVKEAGKELSEFEKNSLLPAFKHMGVKGTSSWATVFAEKKIKKKWESVIKNWSINRKSSFKDLEQWARLNRRLSLMPNDLSLPSDMEVEDPLPERLRVQFFLDSSGSCWGLKDRFFSAALSLDERVFDVDLFCFDVSVHRVDLREKLVVGGGGTLFSSIEEFVTGQDKYPEAVFVVTDGCGGKVSPRFPERWHWFLTGKECARFIPKGSSLYDLSDFE